MAVKMKFKKFYTNIEVITITSKQSLICKLLRSEFSVPALHFTVFSYSLFQSTERTSPILPINDKTKEITVPMPKAIAPPGWASINAVRTIATI